MLNRRGLVAIAILGPVLAPAVLHAQDPAIVGLQTVTTYSAEGHITAVDANARTVTVTYPDGAVRTHSVSPAVANFGATRIGDTVPIAVEDRAELSCCRTARRRTPPNRDIGVVGTAAAGQT